MATSIRSGYIDTWRFVAVSIVICAHLISFKESFILINGNTGVFIFFFISGFVVSKTALREFSSGGTFSITGFYMRRAFRIIPPLMIYLFVGYALGQFGVIDFGTYELLPAATYLCNINLVDCGWYAGHIWSLAFEEQFYLLFPLIFIWIESSYSRRPSIWFFAIAGIVALLPFWFSINWIGKTGYLVIYGLFAMGYLFAKFELRLHILHSHSVVLFALGFALTFLPINLLNNPFLEKYYKFIYLISIPVMIFTSGSSYTLRSIFENQLTKYIGRISYSIYLWQQFFTGYFKDLPIIPNLILLVLMVLGCSLLFTYVESPLIKQSKKLFDLRISRGIPS